MPAVGVSALVAREGALLMVLRGPASPLGGRWSLPGGRLEEGETLERAVRREVQEETGLRVRVGDVVAAFTTPPRERSWVIVCFRAEVRGGRLRPGDDAEAVEWVPVADVRRRRTTPGLVELLRRAGVL